MTGLKVKGAEVVQDIWFGEGGAVRYYNNDSNISTEVQNSTWITLPVPKNITFYVHTPSKTF